MQNQLQETQAHGGPGQEQVQHAEVASYRPTRALPVIFSIFFLIVEQC